MSALSLSVRFAAFYGAVFFVVGVLLPFWPIWLQSRGLSPGQIGVVLAVGPWLRILIDPVVTSVADRGGQGRRIIVVAAGFSVLAFAGFGLAGSFWAILLIMFVYALAFQVLIPLGDAQTMAAVRRHGLDYGRIRLWGSLAFIAAALGVGELLTGRDPDLIWLVALVSLGAVFATTLALREQSAIRGQARWPDILRYLRTRSFLVFILAASLVQASHAVLNGFSGIHWKAAGYSEFAVGLLWGGGVLAEVLLFSMSGAVVARLGARRLLLIGAGTALVRWIILAQTTDLSWLVVAQVMHGITFGATYLATMHYISDTAPEGMKTTAQGAYASITGVVMGLALIASGDLYGSFGGGAFLAMAVVAAVALVLAIVSPRPDLPVRE